MQSNTPFVAGALGVTPDPCKWCGGQVEINSPKAHPKYCSPACLREGQRVNQRRRRNEARAAVPDSTSPCQQCGTDIVYRGPERKRKYCTPECAAVARKEAVRTRAAQRRGDGPDLCKSCGEVFEVPHHHAGQRPLYCSDDCRKHGARARREEREERLAAGESAE